MLLVAGFGPAVTEAQTFSSASPMSPPTLAILMHTVLSADDLIYKPLFNQHCSGSPRVPCVIVPEVLREGERVDGLPAPFLEFLRNLSVWC